MQIPAGQNYRCTNNLGGKAFSFSGHFLDFAIHYLYTFSLNILSFVLSTNPGEFASIRGVIIYHGMARASFCFWFFFNVCAVCEWIPGCIFTKGGGGI